MKLTPAEYKLLDGLDCIDSGMCDYYALRPWAKRAARSMFEKGLLDNREYLDGRVVATALGKRSHARGKS